jgi:hypothetical protein
VSGFIDLHFLDLDPSWRWSASRPGEKVPGTQWIEGCVGPGAYMGDMEERKFLTLPGLELRPLGRPARNICNKRVQNSEQHLLHVSTNN